jgi:hypothetical protein
MPTPTSPTSTPTSVVATTAPVKPATPAAAPVPPPGTNIKEEVHHVLRTLSEQLTIVEGEANKPTIIQAELQKAIHVLRAELTDFQKKMVPK